MQSDSLLDGLDDDSDDIFATMDEPTDNSQTRQTLALPNLPDLNTQFNEQDVINEEEEKASAESDQAPDYDALRTSIEEKHTFVNRDTVIADDGGENYKSFSSQSSDEELDELKQTPMWEFGGLLSQLSPEDADVCRVIK